MIRYIKAVIYRILGVNILKQEALLRLALKEKKLNYKDYDIEIDHINGYNYINGVKLPIIFPDSFFTNAAEFGNSLKKTDFYFNGNMESTGGRKEMLACFINDKNSKIIESNFGRSPFNKYKFNYEYFLELSQSKYGLCPHQKDFTGNTDTMWTYRFLECCMVRTIPVVFTETPLGHVFLEGFYYENEINVMERVKKREGDDALAANFKLCEERHSLNLYYLDMIKNAK